MLGLHTLNYKFIVISGGSTFQSLSLRRSRRQLSILSGGSLQATSTHVALKTCRLLLDSTYDISRSGISLWQVCQSSQRGILYGIECRSLHGSLNIWIRFVHLYKKEHCRERSQEKCEASVLGNYCHSWFFRVSRGCGIWIELFDSASPNLQCRGYRGTDQGGVSRRISYSLGVDCWSRKERSGNCRSYTILRRNGRLHMVSKRISSCSDPTMKDTSSIRLTWYRINLRTLKGPRLLFRNPLVYTNAIFNETGRYVTNDVGQVWIENLTKQKYKPPGSIHD